MEEWKPIQGYEGLYEVSNLGRVRSLDRIITNPYNKGKHLRKGVIITIHYNDGYGQVGLYKNGKHKTHKVHRLVALAFITNDDPEHKKEINHKNEIRGDNRVENLEWCTRDYNNKYSGTTLKMLEGAKKHKNWLKAHEASRVKRSYLKSLSIIWEKRKKPIEVYKDGELVGVFESITKCCKELCLNDTNIYRQMNGESKTYKGYTFKYADK